MAVPPHRLGKRELGPHAFEERMPARIARMIAVETPRNKTLDVLAKLTPVLLREPLLDRVYLCHASVPQVSKLRREGNHFCAYRNVQMLLADQCPDFPIPKIQQAVEQAWDQGCNSHGRIETGGINGTRKHIGTSEVQALLQNLKIPCNAIAIAGDHPHVNLLDRVEEYFKLGAEPALQFSRLYNTRQGPIFLQRPNHSLTIVGIKINQNGSRCLLVFDPGYQPPKFLKSLRSRPNQHIGRYVMRQYQRDERYLKRYHGFEILYRTTPLGS